MLKQLIKCFSAQRVVAKELRELVVPGMLIIGLVCLIRLSSFLQTQEWMVLDTFSRHCPMRNDAEWVTLISVDERDYQTTGFPLSADILAQALTRLQTYQPRVIGLDIFRDLPQGEGQNMLQKILASAPNVVAAEVALSEEPMMNVRAPAGIPLGQVGFADIVVDADGKLRRIVVSARKEGSLYKESLALLLARRYLVAENTEVDVGMLPKFSSSSGGYVRADVDEKNPGSQMLMNFCRLQTPDETIPLRDVLAGDLTAEKLRDRIVLIGKTATHPKDSFITSAVSQTLYSQSVSGQSYPAKIIYGVEVHAHATEQIIGAALGLQFALATWTEAGEYSWIAAWGVLGMTVSVRLRSPWKSVFTLLCAVLLLTLISYRLLAYHNLWVPVVPAALSLCSAGLITTFFDRDARFELAQRRATIERTYEAVHNGPLQRLAAISRKASRLAPADSHFLLAQLKDLNDEMRTIFANMRKEATTRTHSLYLNDATFLDLQEPLSDLLYQVYEQTMAQPLPGFDQVQVFVTPIFETIDHGRYSIAAKRGLCLFLQESLLNAGKYAIGATRVDVVCLSEMYVYRLQIIDNGIGISSQPKSQSIDQRMDRQGTRQARAIARMLKGKFRRAPWQTEFAQTLKEQQGTFCEIVWPK